MSIFTGTPARKSSISMSAIYFGIISLLAVTAATGQVATGTTGIDASGSYTREMRACASGNTQQDRDTCMKEARNAAADKKAGKLNDSGANLQANAAMRCQVLAGEEKAACEARVKGYGETEGSVAGGGVLREVETVVVKPGTAVVIEPKTADPVILVPSK